MTNEEKSAIMSACYKVIEQESLRRYELNALRAMCEAEIPSLGLLGSKPEAQRSMDTLCREVAEVVPCRCSDNEIIAIFKEAYSNLYCGDIDHPFSYSSWMRWGGN